VLFLLLVFVLTGMTLTVLLWVITVFLQGYYYTEPTSGIAWQAPAAGFGLALFLTLWCLLIVNSDGASPTNLPYDTVFRFSPTVDMFKNRESAKELWAVRKGVKEPVAYKLKKKVLFIGGDPVSFYEEANIVAPKPWNPSGVEAIILKDGNETYRFVPLSRKEGQGYQEFGDESGWVMREYTESGPDGRPSAFRWGRFLGNLFLNFTHLGLWFVAFGLVLRFQWGHALLLAIILWLVMTLAILPMLLDQAGAKAVERRGPASAPKADLPRQQFFLSSAIPTTRNWNWSSVLPRSSHSVLS
jgi:hypothetical protein